MGMVCDLYSEVTYNPENTVITSTSISLYLALIQIVGRHRSEKIGCQDKFDIICRYVYI